MYRLAKQRATSFKRSAGSPILNHVKPLLLLGALAAITPVVNAQTELQPKSLFETPAIEYASRSQSAPPARSTPSRDSTQSPPVHEESAPLTAAPVEYATAVSAKQTTTERLNSEVTLSQPRTGVHIDNFSFDNLLEGVVYDFKTDNEKRLEFGGPGIGDWELTRVDEKYDVPFIMLLLLNAKF